MHLCKRNMPLTLTYWKLEDGCTFYITMRLLLRPAPPVRLTKHIGKYSVRGAAQTYHNAM